MTNGMISATASAASTAVAGASASPAKTGSSSGFSGALVQAMGGTGSEGTTASGTALPAGLLVLMGLVGTQTAEQTSQDDLLQLLSGLSKQLEGMDPNAELPAEVQNQLAGLLLLVQNLLAQMVVQPETVNDNGVSAFTVQSDSAAMQPQGNPSANNLPVVQNLQESLNQLSALLSKGTALPADTAALTPQLQQTINALTSLSAAGQASTGQTGQVAAQQNDQQEAARKAAQGPTSSMAEMEQTAAAAAPEVRRSDIALRNPVWQFQMTNATEATPVEGTATPTAIEPSESAGDNGSAPAWTFLKGDNVGLMTAASASAASTQVPVQQFADQMEKFLIKQFLLTQGNGTHEAKIQLHPEHLGQVDIKIMIQNGQLTAQFVTESGAARDLLENQMSQLRTALQGQGLEVERMEVVQQSSNSASASFFQQNQRQPGSGQNGNGTNGRGARGVYDDTAGFEAELDRTTYLREVGYGSALNVKA